MAGFFARLRREKKSAGALAGLIKNIEDSTGRSVSVETAMQVAAVFACARVIANGISQVPLKIYRKSGRLRETASDYALHTLLHRKPNDWQTSFEFRELLAFHLVFTGNAYVYINRSVTGKVLELIAFNPMNVEVKQQEDYSLLYKVRGKSGQIAEFAQGLIWHIRGPSWNGYEGLEAMKIARECIGLAMAIEDGQKSQHKNGTRLSGVLSVDGTMDEAQYKKLKKWIEEEYAGDKNAGGVMILDHAAKFIAQSQTAVDSQTLETRRYQVEEVCRAMGVMPIMIGHADKTTTYASAEQMFLAHVVHTLAPWYERLEQSIDCWLIGDADMAAGYYAKFVEEGLLRGALKDTAEFLTRLTQGGIMTRNEAREKLDMNPIDGLDEPLTPVNMAIGFADPQQPAPPASA